MYIDLYIYTICIYIYKYTICIAKKFIRAYIERDRDGERGRISGGGEISHVL